MSSLQKSIDEALRGRFPNEDRSYDTQGALLAAAEITKHAADSLKMDIRTAPESYIKSLIEALMIAHHKCQKALSIGYS